MSDYFDELGVTPTGPEGANDRRHYKILQVLAILNGVNVELKAPEASKRALEALPVHEFLEGDPQLEDEGNECPICKQNPVVGDKFKRLPCSHQYHEECLLPWLQKSNSCPMCRFVLETDDPVYEELRLFNIGARDRERRREDLHNSMFT